MRAKHISKTGFWSVVSLITTTTTTTTIVASRVASMTTYPKIPKSILKSRQVPSPPLACKASPKSSLACYGIRRTPTVRPERHCASFPSPWHLQRHARSCPLARGLTVSVTDQEAGSAFLSVICSESTRSLRYRKSQDQILNMDTARVVH
ncbi:uncharacterized protein LY79DRAFT_559692 [Colletotrichum navitas]|uniref:Uncharacterized protein n=1 Tax=Colletotrichum navitas TaxID=681940 RepID=A0AAD8PVS1_9PEZI|nr:uncharacterized protein LY79DRAFT_559692 [Colletotrichum navitas]KAK1585091.1 hypothetical protein LY79DRAFT_559692 [Colletotrichum navitas]